MNLEQFASRGLKAQQAVDPIIEPPTWKATIKINLENTTVFRIVLVEMETEKEAREFIKSVMDKIWGDKWEFTKELEAQK